MRQASLFSNLNQIMSLWMFFCLTSFILSQWLVNHCIMPLRCEIFTALQSVPLSLCCGSWEREYLILVCILMCYLCAVNRTLMILWTMHSSGSMTHIRRVKHAWTTPIRLLFCRHYKVQHCLECWIGNKCHLEKKGVINCGENNWTAVYGRWSANST